MKALSSLTWDQTLEGRFLTSGPAETAAASYLKTNKQTTNKNIYFLAVLSLHCCAGFSLVVGSGGYSLVPVLELLIVVDSLVDFSF